MEDNVVDRVRTLVLTSVNRQIANRMSEAAVQVATFSGTIKEIGAVVQSRQPSEPLANLTLALTERTDALATYLENTHPQAVLGDVRRFGGEQPVIAALSAVFVGFAAARVLKVATSQNGS
jgi:hypothetical protein